VPRKGRSERGRCGPYFVLSCSEGGKTVSLAVDQSQAGGAGPHRRGGLSAVRGVVPGVRAADPSSWASWSDLGAGKARKETAEVIVEQYQEVQRIVAQTASARNVDLEGWETTLRAAALAVGAGALEQLLDGIGSAPVPRPGPQPVGRSPAAVPPEVVPRPRDLRRRAGMDRARIGMGHRLQPVTDPHLRRLPPRPGRTRPGQPPATIAHAVSARRRHDRSVGDDHLFTTYGPPLVLKSDNGSTFIAKIFTTLLLRWGVTSLLSPPQWPPYNGSIEAWFGISKTRIRIEAVRHGRFDRWLLDDIEAARQLANCASRPWAYSALRRGSDGIGVLRSPRSGTKTSKTRSAITEESSERTRLLAGPTNSAATTGPWWPGNPSAKPLRPQLSSSPEDANYSAF